MNMTPEESRKLYERAMGRSAGSYGSPNQYVANEKKAKFGDIAPTGLPSAVTNAAQKVGATAKFGYDMAMGGLGKAGTGVMNLGKGITAEVAPLYAGAYSGISRLMGQTDEQREPILKNLAQHYQARKELQAGGLGQITSGIGEAAFGGAVGLASPMLGTSAQAVDEGLKVADWAGSLIGIDGIRQKAYDIGGSALSQVAQGAEAIGSTLSSSSEFFTRNKFKNALGPDGKPLFNEEEIKGLSGLQLNALEGLVDVAGGVALKPVTLGVKGVAKTATKALPKAAAVQKMAEYTKAAKTLFKTSPKSVSSQGWITSLGNTLQRFGDEINTVKASDVSQGASTLSEFARGTKKVMADSFFSESFANRIQSAGRIMSTAGRALDASRFGGAGRGIRNMATSLTPAVVMTKGTMGIGKAYMGMGKYAYESLRRTFGPKIADDVLNASMAAGATPEDVSWTQAFKTADGIDLTPIDMTGVQKKVQNMAAAYAKPVEQAMQGAAELFQTARQNLGGTEGIQGIAQGYKSRLAGIAESFDKLAKGPMASSAAFGENAKEFLQEAFQAIKNASPSSEFGQSLRKVAKALSGENIFSDLNAASQVVEEGIKKAKEGVKEFVDNQELLYRLKNQLRKDKEETIRMYSPSVGGMLDELDEMGNASFAAFQEMLSNGMASARTNAEKLDVLRRMILNEIESKQFPVEDFRAMAYEFDESLGDFVSSGIAALRETTKDTPLKNLFGTSEEVFKTDEMRAIDEIFEQSYNVERPTFLENVADFAKTAISRVFMKEDALAQQIIKEHSESAIDAFGRKLSLEGDQIKRALSGDATRMETKVRMNKMLLDLSDRGIASQTPGDIVGEVFLRGRDIMITRLAKETGEQLNALKQSYQIKDVPVTDAYVQFMDDLETRLGVVKNLDGEIEFSEDSILKLLGADKMKVARIVEFVEDQMYTNDIGQSVISFQGIDNLMVALKDLPGYSGISETGEARKVIDAVIGRFEAAVLEELPEELKQVQALYGQIMNAKRALHRLGKVNDKNLSSMSVWSTVDGNKVKEFDESFYRKAGENISKLNTSQMADYDKLIQDISAITSTNPEQFAEQMETIYNLVEYQNMIYSFVPPPRSSFVGSQEAAFGGADDLRSSQMGALAQRFRDKGPMNAFFGLILFEKEGVAKLREIAGLVQAQAEVVKKFPQMMFNEASRMKNHLNSSSYAKAVLDNKKKVQDTKIGDGSETSGDGYVKAAAVSDADDSEMANLRFESELERAETNAITTDQEAIQTPDKPPRSSIDPDDEELLRRTPPPF